MTSRLASAVLAVVASTATALADPKAEAKQHFDLASAAHKEGRFRDAQKELMLAYALDPRPELLYAIAQVHVKLGECPQAITFYQRFLQSNPKPDHAARAQKAIEVCKTNPPPPEATQPADPAKPREDLGPSREENLRKAAEAEALAASERRKAEEARINAEREREQEKRYNRHPARIWSIVGMGVGAGIAATGGYFALQSRDAQASFTETGCNDRTRLLTAEQLASCVDDAERGEANALRGNILMAAGGAVFVTSLVVMLLDPGNVERPSTASSSVSVTPSSITFTARW